MTRKIKSKSSNKKPGPKPSFKKPGPKPSFTEEMIKQTELLSMLGATDAQIALFFDKDKSTIENWIKKYPEYKAARKKGGLTADMKAVKTMFQRAMGYNFKEEQVFIVKGKPTIIKVKKHVIPNMTALVFWMKNRQRELWSDVQNFNHSGSVNHVHNRLEDIPVEQLSKKAQKMLFEINTKQLANQDVSSN